MRRPSIHQSMDPPAPQPPRPSAPPSPGHLKAPPMTPIRNTNLFEPPSEAGTQPLLMNNNRPIHPTPLGKPPPHIHSEAPPITPQPQHPFGKLVLKIIRGTNLKAGQGVFGRADPYVTLKLGSAECKTRTHKNGGKNPVSATWSICVYFVMSNLLFILNRNGTKSLIGRSPQNVNLRLKSWIKK